MYDFHERVTPPPSLRVVVIDDDLDARQLACLTLEASHMWAYLPTMQVWREFPSGQEAIELLASLPVETPLPHLILCDLEMPGFNGFETVRQLRSLERLKDVPIVMVTTRADDLGFAVQAKECGATAWTTKPVNTAKSVEVIGDALRRSLPRHCVLVVANDYGWETQKTARAILEQHGYRDWVRTINRPAQATTFLLSAAEGVGCIIFDARTALEQFGGYVTMHSYAERTGTPMICLGDSEEHRIWAAAQEVHRYFGKPIVWGDLLTELGTLVPPQAVAVPRPKPVPAVRD